MSMFDLQHMYEHYLALWKMINRRNKIAPAYLSLQLDVFLIGDLGILVLLPKILQLVPQVVHFRANTDK